MFQMFTLFSGRHVGVTWSYTNIAAPYSGPVNCANILTNIWGLGKCKDLGCRKVSSWISYNITNFLPLSNEWVLNYFFIVWQCKARIGMGSDIFWSCIIQNKLWWPNIIFVLLLFPLSGKPKMCETAVSKRSKLEGKG